VGRKRPTARIEIKSTSVGQLTGVFILPVLNFLGNQRGSIASRKTLINQQLILKYFQKELDKD